MKFKEEIKAMKDKYYDPMIDSSENYNKIRQISKDYVITDYMKMILLRKTILLINTDRVSHDLAVAMDDVKDILKTKYNYMDISFMTTWCIVTTLDLIDILYHKTGIYSDLSLNIIKELPIEETNELAVIISRIPNSMMERNIVNHIADTEIKRYISSLYICIESLKIEYDANFIFNKDIQ